MFPLFFELERGANPNSELVSSFRRGGTDPPNLKLVWCLGIGRNCSSKTQTTSLGGSMRSSHVTQFANDGWLTEWAAHTSEAVCNLRMGPSKRAVKFAHDAVCHLRMDCRSSHTGGSVQSTGGLSNGAAKFAHDFAEPTLGMSVEAFFSCPHKMHPSVTSKFL